MAPRPRDARLCRPGTGALTLGFARATRSEMPPMTAAPPRPDDDPTVVVVVEIPRGGRAKFELDPQAGTIWLDRVLSTATHYPAEYGYVLGSASGDDDALDAVVLLEEATVPGCHIRARPIGVLEMTDEHGSDPKLLCVAVSDPTMGTLTDLHQVPPHLLDEIEHFFRVYKQLEPRAHVETGGWHDAEHARDLVDQCRCAFERHEHPDAHEENPMELHLDTSQTALLREVLDSTYRDLRYEIANTNNSEFKAHLRQREHALHTLLERVGGPMPDR